MVNSLELYADKSAIFFMLLFFLRDSCCRVPLHNIKNSYSPNKLEPFEFSDRLSTLNKEMKEISDRIEQLSEI